MLTIPPPRASFSNPTYVLATDVFFSLGYTQSIWVQQNDDMTKFHISATESIDYSEQCFVVNYNIASSNKLHKYRLFRKCYDLNTNNRR